MSHVVGELAPGTTVSGYRIEALIGRGGMGAVYRAEEVGLGRKVALKVIAPELASDERFRKRFLRESRIAASLDHPHVVPIYGAGEQGGLLYLAMRYVEGTDLAKLVAHEGALEPKRALDLLSQVAEALDAAHEQGLVHRDIKPSNVLIATAAGIEHCYLGDFGLTKRIGSNSAISSPGAIVGTLEYLAPEQITGDALDGRADVYSLGCIFYECLTGQVPFPRATDAALLWAHVHDEPPRPSSVRPDLPRELDSVFATALAKDRGERYRSAGELIAASVRSDAGEALPERRSHLHRMGEAARHPKRRRSERKVITCVFCGLVGPPTGVGELDVEDVAPFLGSYRARAEEELERYGGTLEKFVGDAVLALFGAPTAHEDDPERAVRAALAIREWASEDGLELGVGITTGEALVWLDASPAESEGIASGNVVNTAARLQSAAPVNAILVDDVTYRATRGKITYEDAEPVGAKGKAKPVRVWRALEARARFGVDTAHEARTQLVGRERELKTLREGFERARHERIPQLVTLLGVPGIGKSRLVYELQRIIDADPELITWRQGRCLSYGDGVTLWALGEILKAQAGILEQDTSDEVATKLRRATADALSESDATWVESHLLALVGLTEESPLGGDRRSEAFSAWRRFLEGLAEQRPLVLVFEDLHWADETLLDFIDELVDWIADVPLLVVATARPELLDRRAAWGGGKLNSTTLELQPLSDEQTAGLIAHLLATPLPVAESQQVLLERVGGNPLYAEQFADLVSEQGSTQELPLPETLQGIIAARLDALSEYEKTLLQNAAVVGTVFWASALPSRRDPAAALHSLERKGFIRRQSRSSVEGESEHAFAHVLIRDVAYGQVPRAGRAEKHRLAAEWIESLGRPQDHAELLAHHFVSALDYARAAAEETDELAEKARHALRDAGERALALNAFPAAARYYAHALELWPADDPERADLLYALARARHHDLHELREPALEEARDALLANGQPALAAEAGALLADAYWRRGDRDRADGHLERARVQVAELPPSPAKAHVLSQIARFRFLAGRLEEAERTAEEALAMAEQLGLDDIRAHALSYLGAARMVLGDRRGLDDSERSVEIALAARSPHAARALAILAATTSNILADLPRAEDLLFEAERVAQELGFPDLVRVARSTRLWLSLASGTWDDALRQADAFIESGDPAILVQFAARDCRARVRRARGDAVGALEDAQAALSIARGRRDPQLLLPALGLVARIDLEVGNPDEAHEFADELVRSAAEGLPVHLMDFAWIAAHLGHDAVVREVLGRSPWQTGWTSAALALLDGRYSAAADVFHEIGSLDNEAEARLRAGETLVAAEQRAEADEQLAKALAFFRPVGATRFIREAEAAVDRRTSVSQ